jgi:hypothetical protein
VVYRFIKGKQGSIMLRSGEFPGQRSLPTPAILQALTRCFEAWAGAPSSWTTVPGLHPDDTPQQTEDCLGDICIVALLDGLIKEDATLLSNLSNSVTIYS